MQQPEYVEDVISEFFHNTQYVKKTFERLGFSVTLNGKARKNEITVDYKEFRRNKELGRQITGFSDHYFEEYKEFMQDRLFDQFAPSEGDTELDISEDEKKEYEELQTFLNGVNYVRFLKSTFNENT